MFSLTEEEIAFIENDIKVRGIHSPDLSIDLVDHICCLIENRLDGYRNFDTVYQETLLLFGEKGLKEIQDETNRLLTFKHYSIMNATMKISGYLSSLMILAGAFFKFNHWPGASPLMVLGVFLFSVLFLPLLFILKFRSNSESNRSIALSIIGFIASLLICVGILFRIMHWPGARMSIISGGVLLLLGYLPIYFISIYKNTTNKINATATVILIIAGVGLFITESGSGMSRPVSDSFWRGVTESNDLLSTIKKNNLALYKKFEKDSLKMESGNVSQLKNETDALLGYIEEMKKTLIEKATNMSAEERSSIDALRTEGGEDVLTATLLGNEYADLGFTAVKLKARIDAYKKALKSIAPEVNLASLNTGDLQVYGENVSWEQSNFEKLPIPLVIYNMIRIELGIKVAEGNALNQL